MEYEMQHDDIAPETHISELEDRIDELEAENERLREALVDIRNGSSQLQIRTMADNALDGGGEDQ